MILEVRCTMVMRDLGTFGLVFAVALTVASGPKSSKVWLQESHGDDGGGADKEHRTVTERTEGEHAGSTHLQANGYFDEDGTPDRAFFRHTATGKYQLVASLSTMAETMVLAEVGTVSNLGVRTVPPGTYETACAKGYGGMSCDGKEEAEVRLERDGILLFQYESSSQLFYLHDDSFVSAFLSG
ncbi:MAG: hypothetical protein F4024_08005 [Gammaproteobacteria bacterium]|nr:hypothetical protein [Gammaproteobacteria bacterium]